MQTRFCRPVNSGEGYSFVVNPYNIPFAMIIRTLKFVEMLKAIFRNLSRVYTNVFYLPENAEQYQTNVILSSQG